MEQLSQASKQAKDIQESFRKIADLTGNNIRELVKSNEEQTEIWEEIGDSMDQYKQVFGEVESSAVKILTDISEHLHNFTDATKSHFERTVTVANDHVNKAVGQLQSSIEELSEKLDDLSETVEKIDDIYKRAKRL
jgi:methyl-accepting chemotaxis protein